VFALAWARLAPAMACALRGERDELLRIMTPELRAAAQWDGIFAWWAADCFALVNEADGAMDFLERAVEFGFINEPWRSKYEPFLSSLRSQPRFNRLMEGIRSLEGFRAVDPPTANEFSAPVPSPRAEEPIAERLLCRRSHCPYLGATHRREEPTIPATAAS
jgi:hypothetical protein